MNISRPCVSPGDSSGSLTGNSSLVTQNDFCSWESLALAAQFRIRALAQICHVSVRTLQRHFQKHYGLTVSQWLREFRLEQARLHLASAQSIKAVAYELGYKRPSHFTRDFKEHFGIPPSLWLGGKTSKAATVAHEHSRVGREFTTGDLFR